MTSLPVSAFLICHDEEDVIETYIRSGFFTRNGIATPVRSSLRQGRAPKNGDFRSAQTNGTTRNRPKRSPDIVAQDEVKAGVSRSHERSHIGLCQIDYADFYSRGQKGDAFVSDRGKAMESTGNSRHPC